MTHESIHIAKKPTINIFRTLLRHDLPFIPNKNTVLGITKILENVPN